VAEFIPCRFGGLFLVSRQAHENVCVSLSRRARGARAAAPFKKITAGGKFFLAWGGSWSYFEIDPARKKAGKSGDRVTPCVAFFFKARPEVHKAKAQVSTPRRVGA
jgi:hypothetical protein